MRKKGDPALPGAGRPKGSQNKIPAKIKEAIEEAFEAEGGVEYLRGIAKSDPRTFCGLLKEILPKDVNLDAKAGLAEILAMFLGDPEEETLNG